MATLSGRRETQAFFAAGVTRSCLPNWQQCPRIRRQRLPKMPSLSSLTSLVLVERIDMATAYGLGVHD